MNTQSKHSLKSCEDSRAKNKKKKRYKKPESVKLLENLHYKAKKRKTSLPEYAIPKTKFRDDTANGLTKCVIAWINLNNGQAERISNTGRYVDNTKIVTDVIGRKRKIGSGKWIPGTGTNGTADISATIHGRSVKIEVKIGRDKQSQAQKKYQKQIEKSGGIYFIARDFTQFVEWYNAKFPKL